jgi:deazaflavin-dependent oxidoreductase (nitroreductase family)
MTTTDEEHREKTAMTNSAEPPAAPPANNPDVRAQTLPLQGVVNKVIRGLLCAPLLSRYMGKRLVTLYIVGRKSGRRYAVPVAYTQFEGSLLVGSQFPWIRNLRTGETVEIRLTGKRRQAQVRVLTDQTGVVEHLALMCRDNHQFAKFNQIALDHNGDPVSEDLHLAWASGARVAVLTQH